MPSTLTLLYQLLTGGSFFKLLWLILKGIFA